MKLSQASRDSLAADAQAAGHDKLTGDQIAQIIEELLPIILKLVLAFKTPAPPPAAV